MNIEIVIMLTTSSVVNSALPVNEERALAPLLLNGHPDLGRAQVIAGNDAVEVRLASSSAEQSEEERSSEGGGLLGVALKSIAYIAQQMKETQALLSGTAPGSARYAAVQQELSNLNESYQSAMANEGLRRSVDVLGAVRGSLMSGASGDTVSQSLDGDLLGGAVAALIKRGDLSRLGSLSTSLDSLATVDLTLPSGADMVMSVTDTALNSLAAGPVRDVAPAEPPPEGELRLVAIPEIEHLTFGESSDLSIGLRALKPADVFKAAAAHMDLDLERAIVLIGPQKDEEGKKSKSSAAEEDRQQEQSPRQGLFYGENQPAAVITDPASTGRLVFHEGDVQEVKIPGGGDIRELTGQ